MTQRWDQINFLFSLRKHQYWLIRIDTPYIVPLLHVHGKRNLRSVVLLSLWVPLIPFELDCVGSLIPKNPINLIRGRIVLGDDNQAAGINVTLMSGV